jgi:hypothetical protein
MKIRLLPFVSPYSSIVFYHTSWGFKIRLSSFTGESKHVRLVIYISLTKWSKVKNLSRKYFKKIFKTTRTILSAKLSLQKRGVGGVVKIAVSSELSLVSGNYHEKKSKCCHWMAVPPCPTKISAIGAMNLETKPCMWPGKLMN